MVSPVGIRCVLPCRPTLALRRSPPVSRRPGRCRRWVGRGRCVVPAIRVRLGVGRAPMPRSCIPHACVSVPSGGCTWGRREPLPGDGLGVSCGVWGRKPGTLPVAMALGVIHPGRAGWCARQGSNLHDRGRRILNPLRLPDSATSACAVRITTLLSPVRLLDLEARSPGDVQFRAPASTAARDTPPICCISRLGMGIA